MSEFTISKQIELDAGHRVPLHASKCKNLHGHRYAVQLTIDGQLISEGSETGMVKDFGFVKELLNRVVHDPCDHSLILSVDDPMLPQMLFDPPDVTLSDLKAMIYTDFQSHVTFGIQGTRIYCIKRVPTAENLAKHWGMLITPLLPEGVLLASLDVWETPTSVATWTPK